MTETLLHLAPRARSRDVGELSEKMIDLLTGAVDVLEVTAGLEAEGIGDRIAKEYGHDDVFKLAAFLYAGTVRRPARPKPAPNPWAGTGRTWVRNVNYLLRGLLFGMPGAGYVAAAPLLGQRSAGLVLTLSLVLCWPVSQGVAALAYSRPSPAGTRRVLRLGVLYGVPLTMVQSIVIGLLLDSGTAVVAVACAQSLYLMTASATLVGGAEVGMLVALLPGVVVTFTGLPGEVVIVGWAVTGLAVLLLALDRTCVSKDERDGMPMSTGGVSWIALRAAGPYALFGLLAGALLTFTIVCAYGGYGAPPDATSAAMVALSVSMGIAEWVLFAFRSRGHDLLQVSFALREFVFDVRLALVDLVGRYLALLAVLLGVAITLTEPRALPIEGAVQVFCGYLLLGGALLLALTLQSCGRTRASLLCCSTALAAEVGVMITISPDPSVVQLSGAVVLFTVLFCFAVAVLGRATTHQ
ncbi:MAG: hypothetical protein ABIS86_24700 [Streptosporangiaceae bacterium]